MSKGAPRVELQTTIGSFEVELYTDHAPKTCKNFIELSKRGYYNGTPFHRVIRVG
jgi:peptidyl-prolyl cis-trans isomerase-like 1